MGQVMANEHPWKDPTRPLQELARTFGFEPNKLELDEIPDELNFYTKLDSKAARRAFPKDEQDKAEKLARLDEVLKTLHEKYGPSVTFKIKSESWEILSLDSYERSRLDDLYKALEVESNLILDLRIDKTKLLN